MSEAVVTVERPPKSRRIVKIVSWILGLVVVLVLLHLAGVDVWGWISELWDTLTEISIVYILLGCVFQALQTTLTALGWYGILRYAYPGGVTYMAVLASYAAGVALNNFLPANIGTFVTLVMYVAVVRGSTFPGILAGYLVQKIFYMVIGSLIYLYLFLQIEGSFDFRFGGERDAITNHPVLVLGIIGGGLFLIVLLVRIFWRWVKGMWVKAKKGAAILGDLGAYTRLVLLPQMGGYVAKVLVIIIFLAAYSIPVTFGSVMSVLGSNQLANLLSLTPGGLGVNQAFNAFARELHELDHRHRVFARPAACHDGLQRRLRNRAHLHGLRLERRLEARQGLVHRREGEGVGDEVEPWQGPRRPRGRGRRPAWGRRRLTRPPGSTRALALRLPARHALAVRDQVGEHARERDEHHEQRPRRLRGAVDVTTTPGVAKSDDDQPDEHGQRGDDDRGPDEVGERVVGCDDLGSPRRSSRRSRVKAARSA